MQLPFKQAKDLRGYLANENQKTFAAYTGTETIYNRVKRKQPESRVGDYPITGPLGSKGPFPPISLGSLHGTLNEPNGKMKESGKETAL